MRALLFIISLLSIAIHLQAQRLVEVVTELAPENHKLPLLLYTKKMITYGANQKISTAHTVQWIEATGTWINIDSIYYLYDDTLLIDKIRAVYQHRSKKWRDFYRYRHTYNADKQLVSMMHSYGANGEWPDANKTIYTYDAAGNKAIETSSSYRPYSDEWFYTGRVLYTYNNEGRLIKQLKQRIDKATNEWIVSYADTFIFNDDGNCIESVMMDNYEGKLIKELRYLYTYDDKGRQIKTVMEWWNEKKKRWAPDDVWVNTYTDFGESYQETHFNCNNRGVKCRIISSKTYRYE